MDHRLCTFDLSFLINSQIKISSLYRSDLTRRYRDIYSQIKNFTFVMLIFVENKLSKKMKFAYVDLILIFILRINVDLKSKI